MISESPILLSSQLTVTPNAKLELVTPELQNPFNAPMLIDEIRIAVMNPGAFVTQSIYLMRLRLSLGRVPLTSDFIPVPMLGRRLNSIQDPWQPLPQIFTWRLPKSLYIHPTEFLVPHIFYDASGLDPALLPASVQVRVSYVGRSIPSDRPAPKSIAVPWVALYESPVIEPVGPFIHESAETNLYNPFVEDVQVQRFIGRTVVYSAPNSVREFVEQGTINLRMTDSSGRHAIRDTTPFANVFFRNDRAWTVNAVVPSKSFYLASLEGSPTPADQMFRSKAFISMIGHRDVVVRW